MNPQPIRNLQAALINSKAANHRALLVLSGDRKRSWAVLTDLLETTEFSRILCYQAPENLSARYYQFKKASDFLGTNNDCVVFDANAGFDPDAFGIIGGTVNGGGLAILMTPPLHTWPALVDPENRRLAVHPFQATDVTGYYLSRISRIINNRIPSQLIGDIEYRLLLTDSTSIAPPQTLPNSQQSDLIDHIKLTVTHSNNNTPTLVTADRGRGKSTALGLVSARLLKTGNIENIIVTAPGKASLNSFFQHADSILDESSPIRPRFVATDVLLKNSPKAELLIIDEAAAIPLPILLKLLSTYPQCVLSSTMHGYEGVGRGYAVRLRSLLDKHYPGWHEKHLTLPARFAADDPLENFTAELLMLNASNMGFRINTCIDKSECLLEELSAEELEKDESKLTELYALLVQAHYQTKPLDLKNLLDGPNLRIFVLTYNRKIVAAVLLATEQIADDTQLQNAIIHGERRPRGHLLSQLLAYQNIETEFLDLKIARVVRIAVQSQLQRSSLGSHFLELIFNYCNLDRFDAIGASFGATKELLDFWFKNKYQTLHLGYRRNASSASYSAVVFRCISQRAKVLSEYALTNSLHALHFRSTYSNDTQLLDTILQQSKNTSLRRNPSFTNAVVSSYTHRHRDFESSHAELYRYLNDVAVQITRIPTIQQQALKLIVLQRSDWSVVSKALKLQGRKDCENLIKTALRTISDQTQN